MAVVNGYDPTLIKTRSTNYGSTNRLSERQNAASHNRYRIWCVVKGSDSVHLKSTSRIASVICVRRQRENIEKPCVDQKKKKNDVELSDIEI